MAGTPSGIDDDATWKNPRDHNNNRIVLAWLLKLHIMGFKIVPLTADHRPAIKWADIRDGKKLLNSEFISSNHDLFKNVAACFGEVPREALHYDPNTHPEHTTWINCGLDIDGREVCEKLKDYIEKWKKETFVTKTKKEWGYHIYFCTGASLLQHDLIGDGYELKVRNGMLTLPGSTHRSDPSFVYEFAGKQKIAFWDEKQINELLELLQEFGINEKHAGGSAGEKLEVIPAHDVPLSADDIKSIANEISDILKDYYLPNHRNDIMLVITGMLYRCGVDLESAKEIVRTICNLVNDSEVGNRINTLTSTYNNGRYAGRPTMAGIIARIKGFNDSDAKSAADRVVGQMTDAIESYVPRPHIRKQQQQQSLPDPGGNNCNPGNDNNSNSKKTTTGCKLGIPVDTFADAVRQYGLQGQVDGCYGYVTRLEDPTELIIYDTNKKRIAKAYVKVVKKEEEEPEEGVEESPDKKKKTRKVTTYRLVHENVIIAAVPYVHVRYDPTATATAVNNLTISLSFETPGGILYNTEFVRIDKLADEVRKLPVVLKSRDLVDNLTATIFACCNGGRFDYEETTDLEGFFFIKDPGSPGSYTLKKFNVDVKEVDAARAQRAVQAIRTMYSELYSASDEERTRFVHLLRLAICAPFDYAHRQILLASGPDNSDGYYYYSTTDLFFPGVELAGRSKTGKTTGYGRLFLAMYRLPYDGSKYYLPAGSVETPGRFTKRTGRTTMPLIIDELGIIANWEKDRGAYEMIELLKNQRTLTAPREKLTKNSENITDPSLSYPIITHNNDIIREDGFARRYTQIQLTERDVKTNDSDRMKKFSMFFEEHGDDYSAIGDFAINYILSHQGLLKKDWRRISREVLQALFALAGEKEYPDWLDLEIKDTSMDDIADSAREEIRKVLKQALIDHWKDSRSDIKVPVSVVEKYGSEVELSKVQSYSDLRECLVALLATDRLTFAKCSPEADRIYMFSSIQSLFKSNNNNNNTGNRMSMQRIADLTGFRFMVGKHTDRSSCKMLVTTIDDFINFIKMEDFEDSTPSTAAGMDRFTGPDTGTGPSTNQQQQQQPSKPPLTSTDAGRSSPASTPAQPGKTATEKDDLSSPGLQVIDTEYGPVLTGGSVMDSGVITRTPMPEGPAYARDNRYGTFRFIALELNKTEGYIEHDLLAVQLIKSGKFNQDDAIDAIKDAVVDGYLAFITRSKLLITDKLVRTSKFTAETGHNGA